MNSDEIRSAFLKFFEEKGHKVIPSSSLIPKDNPTLLLTTAGMVQIEPYFKGLEEPPSRRLASCQKCFRTTDIEEVGDDRHNTFFEMLGNFSVGDYFKKEAIAWAWEFFIGRMKIDPANLWVTIYLDDDEAFNYWKATGVPENKIVRCGEKDNYWGPAGSTGPCGPCSEIHYDFGADKGCGKADCKPNCECGRFKEIWNLVFTQYNQDENGKRTPLPKPNIDTGMGLERITMVMSGKNNIYENDIFKPLLDKASELTGKKYGANANDDSSLRVIAEHGRSLSFLIADGVLPDNEGRGYVLRRLLRRAQYFCNLLTSNKLVLVEIAKVAINKLEHVYPELQINKTHIIQVINNEVERFQKAIVIGNGILNNTFLKMRNDLDDLYVKFEKDVNVALSKQSIEGKNSLGSGVRDAVIDFRRASPTLKYTLMIGGIDIIGKTFKDVEEGVNNLEKTISQYSSIKPDNSINPDAFYDLKKDINNKLEDIKIKVNSITRQITGLELFVLHDTYGFPVELTREIVAKSGFAVDMAGFDREMDKQRERARASHKFDNAEAAHNKVKLDFKSTEFVGYECLARKSKILKFIVDNKPADAVQAGQKASIVLDYSPFYGEMGGQVGDKGEITGPNGKFTVIDTVRLPGDLILHEGTVTEGTFKTGEEAEASVDIERRKDIARNHTATHLLQTALKQVLGEHIQQRGSLVAPERLRFDFSHLAAMKPEEIKETQRIVNEKIRQDLEVAAEKMDYKKAVSGGATALFDEKYGDVVRVMSIGAPVISQELCGGTHVERTGEIGYFHILSEGSVGSGIRRIEAVTGREAEKFIHRRFENLENIARVLETTPEKAVEKLSGILEEMETQKRQIRSIEKEKIKQAAESSPLEVKKTKGGVSFISKRVEAKDQQSLRETIDIIRGKLPSGIIVLGAVINDRPMLIASTSADLVEIGYNAGDIIREASKITGGGGGGKANFAQAGGKDTNKLDEALDAIERIIGQR